MGGVTAAIIAIAGLVLGWITIEIACKPCLEQGRQAIDRSLNPDYDPDDDDIITNNNNTQTIRAPLNPPAKIVDDDDQEAATSRLA